ncbi:MAG: cupin domain-containing protein [Rubrivivax sp.]|nr:cupin domain-containing protein [Rubrivivax sp.]
MDIHSPTPLLGGLTATAFMRRHWQKKPLLVRQALPGVTPPLARAALFDLAGSADVESRLVVQDGSDWRVRQGPLPRRALPPARAPGWTLLVQGLDLHVAAAREMLARFRFIPDARLDDLMLSWASDGGGVGPHLDSYDVFLIQVHGRRRWRIGRVADDACVDGLPLKILRHFEPEHEWLLEPGDMLYLPPRWGHDGVAEGECMTCSVGFRAPGPDELARELLQRLGEDDERTKAPYRDPGQAATARPGEMPAALQDFARAAVQRLLGQPDALERALGEALTEPKPRVWFESRQAAAGAQGVQLDPATRMLYDARHVFINGESFRAGGRDARLMRTLADQRELSARDCAALSANAAALVDDWVDDGWLHRGC